MVKIHRRSTVEPTDCGSLGNECESGNPAGRPKGSRNKFTETFWNDFYGAWQGHGAAALEKIATHEPVFCALRCLARAEGIKVENDLA
jgi:hypothetical protein